MAAKLLTKSCRCALCGDAMAAGEPFAWHEGSRPVAIHGRSHTGARLAGAVGKAVAWKPRHTHDCLLEKVAKVRPEYAALLAAQKS